MRAVMIRAHGGRDQLRLEEVLDPEPGPGEALVRVAAVGLNRMDVFLRQGLTGPGVRSPRLPHVPGVECAGTLAGLGPGADTPFAVGDRVVVFPGLSCGACRHCRRGQEGRCADYRIIGEDTWGGQADLMVAPAANLLGVPDSVPLIVAAAAPVAFTTAWSMLVTGARVRIGERVAVVGASGGVATAAIAIAAHAGAEVLAGTRGSAKAVRLTALPGVTAVFDTGVADWHEQVLDLTGGNGADIVVDAVGAPTWPDSIRSLATGGRMAICGATGGDRPDFSIRELYQSHRSIVGAPLGGWSDFHDAMALVLAGVLQPVIHTTLPLEQVAEAHRQMEADEHLGKIVLTVGSVS